MKSEDRTKLLKALNAFSDAVDVIVETIDSFDTESKDEANEAIANAFPFNSLGDLEDVRAEIAVWVEVAENMTDLSSMPDHSILWMMGLAQYEEGVYTPSSWTKLLAEIEKRNA